MMPSRRKDDQLPARLARWLAVPTATVAALSAAWVILDWADAKPATQRDLRPMWAAIESVSKATSLNSWQLLEARRKTGGLSPVELTEYCALSNLLNIRGEMCR